MIKLRALLAKIHDDRGNLTVIIGFTLLTMVIGTLLTMNTVTAAALMQSSGTTVGIRSSIEDAKNIAFQSLISGQSNVVGVSSTLNGTRAYVSAQNFNPGNSSITLTIIGESLNDNVSIVTTQTTFSRYQANFFGGYDSQGVPFWIASPTSGTGTNASPLYTGYQRGQR
jgi:hypothetical protein